MTNLNIVHPWQVVLACARFFVIVQRPFPLEGGGFRVGVNYYEKGNFEMVKKGYFKVQYLQVIF
jgi:hypothetical protein